MFTFNDLPAWLALIENGGDAGGSGDGDQGGQGTGGDGDQGGDGSGQGEKTPKLPQTQEELSRIIEGRVAQAKRQFADYDDLRAFRDSHETDVEKAVEAARREAAGEVEKTFGRRLAEVEVRAAAAAMKFHDPADAIRLVDDLDGLVKGGEVDAKAIGAQLQKVAEAKPYLLDGAAQKSLRRPGPRRDAEDVSDEVKQKPGEKRSAALIRGYSRR